MCYVLYYKAYNTAAPDKHDKMYVALGLGQIISIVSGTQTRKVSQGPDPKGPNDSVVVLVHDYSLGQVLALRFPLKVHSIDEHVQSAKGWCVENATCGVSLPESYLGVMSLLSRNTS